MMAVPNSFENRYKLHHLLPQLPQPVTLQLECRLAYYTVGAFRRLRPYNILQEYRQDLRTIR